MYQFDLRTKRLAPHGGGADSRHSIPFRQKAANVMLSGLHSKELPNEIPCVARTNQMPFLTLQVDFLDG